MTETTTDPTAPAPEPKSPEHEKLIADMQALLADVQPLIARVEVLEDHKAQVEGLMASAPEKQSDANLVFQALADRVAALENRVEPVEHPDAPVAVDPNAPAQLPQDGRTAGMDLDARVKRLELLTRHIV